MFVREYRSSPAITVGSDTPLFEALKLMQLRKIRRLPVVDRSDGLAGIVSERDLLHAASSPATSLRVWEMNYRLGRLIIADVMTHNMITVTPETSIRDAAELMLRHKIGGIAVVEGSRVLGIITESDIFHLVVEKMPELDKTS